MALRDAWSASAKRGVHDRRAVDIVADASWRSTSFALTAKTLLSGTPEDDDEAARAAKLHARLFPDGLTFTQLTFTSQWAHADRLLSDMEKEGLTKELDKLIGKEHLAFIRRAHAAYGDALTITEAAKEAVGGVREPLRGVQVAIQEYVFALFAEHKPSNPKNHALLQKALAPIDEHRAQADAAPSTSTPATPVEPVVEPGPEPVGPPPDEPIPDVE